eukprot:TRINITY_DN1884_c0_g1_i1.p1 TRINITY_DN1884_c0_g1~~TRINITY_DN1884_c0_g1_i1.p1  ORF type:complete len:930 (+),score=209.53 TRINITY_DN1884_c0_g1_i1:83-2872(+)
MWPAVRAAAVVAAASVPLAVSKQHGGSSVLHCEQEGCNQKGLDSPTCPKGLCKQHEAIDAACAGGRCEQRMTLRPTCDGGGCDQGLAVGPYCLGGGCAQLGTQCASCDGGGCDQLGATGATCRGGGCTGATSGDTGVCELVRGKREEPAPTSKASTSSKAKMSTTAEPEKLPTHQRTEAPRRPEEKPQHEEVSTSAAPQQHRADEPRETPRSSEKKAQPAKESTTEAATKTSAEMQTETTTHEEAATPETSQAVQHQEAAATTVRESRTTAEAATSAYKEQPTPSFRGGHKQVATTEMPKQSTGLPAAPAEHSAAPQPHTGVPAHVKSAPSQPHSYPSSDKGDEFATVGFPWWYCLAAAIPVVLLMSCCWRRQKSAGPLEHPLLKEHSSSEESSSAIGSERRTTPPEDDKDEAARLEEVPMPAPVAQAAERPSIAVDVPSPTPPAAAAAVAAAEPVKVDAAVVVEEAAPVAVPEVAPAAVVFAEVPEDIAPEDACGGLVSAKFVAAAPAVEAKELVEEEEEVVPRGLGQGFVLPETGLCVEAQQPAEATAEVQQQQQSGTDIVAEWLASQPPPMGEELVEEMPPVCEAEQEPLPAAAAGAVTMNQPSAATATIPPDDSPRRMPCSSKGSFVAEGQPPMEMPAPSRRLSGQPPPKTVSQPAPQSSRQLASTSGSTVPALKGLASLGASQTSVRQAGGLARMPSQGPEVPAAPPVASQPGLKPSRSFGHGVQIPGGGMASPLLSPVMSPEAGPPRDVQFSPPLRYSPVSSLPSSGVPSGVASPVSSMHRRLSGGGVTFTHSGNPHSSRVSVGGISSPKPVRVGSAVSPFSSVRGGSAQLPVAGGSAVSPFSSVRGGSAQLPVAGARSSPAAQVQAARQATPVGSPEMYARQPRHSAPALPQQQQQATLAATGLTRARVAITPLSPVLQSRR